MVLLIPRRQFEGHQFHVATRIDGGQPAGGADAVARLHATMKSKLLFAVDQVGDVERDFLVGPELPVGVEAIDHGVRRRRDQLALCPHVADGRNVVPNRSFGDLEGGSFVTASHPARIGHYCNNPWSFMASPMSPLTFNFCCMNAVTGFNFPVAMFIQSSVDAISVVFGLCAGPGVTLAAPSAIFNVH